jgi:hypothetical protein
VRGVACNVHRDERIVCPREGSITGRASASRSLLDGSRRCVETEDTKVGSRGVTLLQTRQVRGGERLRRDTTRRCCSAETHALRRKPSRQNSQSHATPPDALRRRVSTLWVSSMPGNSQRNSQQSARGPPRGRRIESQQRTARREAHHSDGCMRAEQRCPLVAGADAYDYKQHAQGVSS